MAVESDRLPDFDWDRCEEGSVLPNRDRVDAMAERLAHAAKLIAPMTKQIEDLVAEGRAPIKATFASHSPASEFPAKLERNNSSTKGSNVWQRTRQNSSANLDNEDDDSDASSKGSRKSRKKQIFRPSSLQFSLDAADSAGKGDANSVQSTLTQPSTASQGTKKGKINDDQASSLILEGGSLVSKAFEISGGSDGVQSAAPSFADENTYSTLPLNLNLFCLPRYDRVGEVKKVKHRGEAIFKETPLEAKQVEAGYCMADPRNRYRIVWDLGIVFPLLCYIVISMPFRFVRTSSKTAHKSICKMFAR